MKCEDVLPNGDGKPDARANKLIERAWSEWGKRKNCTRDKRSGWIAFPALGFARHGSRRRGARSHSSGRIEQNSGSLLSLSTLTACRLTSSTRARTAGKFGAASNSRPAARSKLYRVLPYHPADVTGGYAGRAERVIAEDMLLVTARERPEQTLGALGRVRDAAADDAREL